MNSQGRIGKCMETLTVQEVSEASLMHTSLMHWCTFSTDAGERRLGCMQTNREESKKETLCYL